MLSDRFRPLIEAEVATYKTYNLPADVVQGVIEQESSGRWYAYRYEPGFYETYLRANKLYAGRDPREVSASYGLMQVMFTTAVENGFLGEAWDLFRPSVNIHLGTKHLDGLITWARGQYVGPATGAEEKIIRSALAAYNGGKRGNLPDVMPDRNAGYADSVFDHINQIKRLRAGR
jgi:soluble lytic murein transglycosylase-like protein